MYKLLIVDDEPFIREYTMHFYPWKDMGFEVAGEAGNGRDALAFAEKTPVDVILTDVLMPVMDGVQLAQSAAALNPVPKVLIFSAYSDFEYAKQAINAGAVGYVLKSDDQSTFIQTFAKVRQMLDKERGMVQGEAAEASQLVCSAVNYIQQHYADDITLADVARYVSVHPVHLSRSISAQLKKNYLDILTECRVQAAKPLLRTTSQKVYEIAEAVGYRKSAYFIEVFKRQTGMTPQQYRDQKTEERT